MAVRLVYRSYGGDNMKDRPGYYSKLLSLASCVRAGVVAGTDMVFVNNGEVPSDRLRLMEQHGEVFPVPQGPVTMRQSYLTGLTLPLKRSWPAQDVVYFCEDDYLHRADAFTRLGAAARELRSAQYFALYGSTPRHQTPAYADAGDQPFPPGWRMRPEVTVDGCTWVNIPSTTSTFGARVGALAQDYSIFRQGMLPYRHNYMDHETCLVYQGHVPFKGGEILRGHSGATGRIPLAKSIALAPFRLGLDARALTRRHEPHLLYAADPNLACHLEEGFMSPGVNWSAVARETAEWAGSIGHPVDLKGAA